MDRILAKLKTTLNGNYIISPLLLVKMVESGVEGDCDYLCIMRALAGAQGFNSKGLTDRARTILEKK